MQFVTAERQRLLSTIERVGAEAPTLCAGWDTEELLRHLIVREIHPHSQVLSKLPGKATDKYRDTMEELRGKSFDDLVEIFRTGRQKFSPLKLSPIDQAVNTLEYVIHHEDVRRAQDPPLGRVLSSDDERSIFNQLRIMAQLLFLTAPVRVVLHSPDFGDITALATKRHDTTVTVIGNPLELAMFAFGREADVEFSGDETDITKLKNSDRSV
ncbi:TIGR03085 family metal-binding protein [Flaviflexus huanghaiensis]|uniref:TIGR03085 family metal-binding protein n=1 Tax=Flaviflexus huanghaiensis TaxID=1111473 RepID=UPI0015F7A842|nr:TIGR03085 family metal-binding protein [Flaviflexus huanghaiensis]